MFAQHAQGFFCCSSHPEGKKQKELTLGKDTHVTLPWKQTSSEQASLAHLSPTNWFLIKDTSAESAKH